MLKTGMKKWTRTIIKSSKPVSCVDFLSFEFNLFLLKAEAAKITIVNPDTGDTNIVFYKDMLQACKINVTACRIKK